MNKLLLLSALTYAASTKMTSYTTSVAEHECFSFDASTMEYVAGSYIDSLTMETSTTDPNNVKYTYSFDVTFAGGDSCDQVFQSYWNAIWTDTTGDDSSTTTMFECFYEEWADDSTTSECTGSYADSSSTSFTSADPGLDTSKTICAYDAYFIYQDGTDSSGTITATTQVVTFYTDNALVATTSAFVLVGLASYLF